MKSKPLIIFTGNIILIVLLILLQRIQVKDVFFIYVVVLIPSFVLVNLEFLLRRKQKYSVFLLSKLYVNLGIIALLFCFILIVTQPKYISKDKAISDLDFMVETLENVHPDIYHIISKNAFSIEFSKEIDALPERVTELEFFKTCARLTSHFRTSHTRPMEHLIASNYLFRNAFPFEIRILNDRLFIINDLSLFNSVPVGSEIIEINNRSVNQLIKEWSKLASYESMVNRNHLITNPGHIGIWNDFKSYKIKYIEYNSQKSKSKAVNGGMASNIFSSMKLKSQQTKDLIYKELTSEIGYIGFFSCMDLENYEDFFWSSFGSIKDQGIENLIIDIRDNEGGYTIIADDLMQYIFHQQHQSLDSGIVKVSEELIATGKVKDKLWFVEEPEVGRSYTRVLGLRELKDYPRRYEGNTYLLTNSGTFSAGQGFASAYKCYGEGTIIGEETGGVTVNFGDVHIFELPNTGLEIMTSWEQAFSACGTDNQRGVLPDFMVNNSIEDHINNTDRVLEFTLKLISDRNYKSQNTD